MSAASNLFPVGSSGFEPVRLPFAMPSFKRVSWASDDARKVWEDRLVKTARTWEVMEFESIRVGLRPAGLFAVDPQDFCRCESEVRDSGLAAAIVARVGEQDSRVLFTVDETGGDKPVSLHVVVGQPDAVETIRLAYCSGDLIRVGSALGYPHCCCLFFQHHWSENGYRDMTWPMAVASHAEASEDYREVVCEGPPETNTLWQWLGIRAVPHLPCSFNCEHSAELARAWLNFGISMGVANALDDLIEILSWPVEWSSLHAIAEIKTPILKMITATDAFAYKHTVRRRGDRYPDEGATGLAFPYHVPEKRKLSSSIGFRRGLSR